jgi:hypothetical protein
MIVEFELNGQKFGGLNRGPAHTFSCACTRAGHWRNWRRRHQARSRWFHQRAPRENAGIALVSYQMAAAVPGGPAIVHTLRNSETKPSKAAWSLSGIGQIHPSVSVRFRAPAKALGLQPIGRSQHACSIPRVTPAMATIRPPGLRSGMNE